MKERCHTPSVANIPLAAAFYTLHHGAQHGGGEGSTYIFGGGYTPPLP